MMSREQLLGNATTPAVERRGLQHVEHVMGMAVSIDVRDTGVSAGAISELVDWLHHVDRTFSTYDEHSPITALGRGDVTSDEVDEEIREVLRRCESFRRATAGAFDVFRIPAPNGTTLDPSGYVKGWAVERGAEILERHGATNFCINAGGDIAVRGQRTSTEPWRIGIRHPEIDQAIAAVVLGRGRLAVATSATYERGAHIIDPLTGEACTDLASATVVGPELGTADALATSVFVMGVDGLDWITRFPDYDAYVITHDSSTMWTDGFAGYREHGAVHPHDR